MSVVGIVCAMKSEASCIMNLRFPLYKLARPGENTRLCLCGVGTNMAADAASLLQKYGVDALVSFGVAAALDPSLTPGDLVLPEAILSEDKIGTGTEAGAESEENRLVNQEWRNRIQRQLSSQLTIVGGTLVTSQVPLTSREAKLELGKATGACAMDMESADVAGVAAKAGIPFIAIRAIIDPVEFSPPEALLSVVYPDGSVQLFRFLSLLLNRSVDLKTIFHLALAMQAARTTLLTVVKTLGMSLDGKLTDRIAG
jgi:adenosylhomocysteine nucleosidase